MCIVSAEAKLTKTKIMSMAIDNGRHLIAYSNKAKNTSGRVNSMILPIPGKLDKSWFYDTTSYNDFLDDIRKQSTIEMYLSLGMRSKGIDRSFESFEVGFYKIVTTNDIDSLKEHLSTLDDSQRPEISDELLDFFKSHYKGWSFVVCIFSGNKEMDAQPIMFEYEPFDYNTVYFPTMDSHTGGAPDLTEKVKMDHTIILNHSGLNESKVPKLKFSQDVPEILKRRKFVAYKYKESLINGDLYVSLSELGKSSDEDYSAYEMIKRRSSISPSLQES